MRMKKGRILIIAAGLGVALLHLTATLVLSSRQSSLLAEALETGDQELFRQVHYGESQFRVLTYPVSRLPGQPHLLAYLVCSLLWGSCVSFLVFTAVRFAGERQDRLGSASESEMSAESTHESDE